MPLDMALALAGFAFVMSITPGPSNFLALASGVNFGFLRSVPFLLGVTAGFLSMVLGVGLGLGQVLEAMPGLYTVLKALSFGYVLWLAWKIAWSRSLGDDGGKEVKKPLSFLAGALLQLVNPKAWAVALIVTVAYTVPENYLTSLIVLILIFGVVIMPSIGAWAAFGTVLRRFLGGGRRVAVFNILMAILLVGSMAPVILGSFG